MEKKITNTENKFTFLFIFSSCLIVIFTLFYMLISNNDTIYMCLYIITYMFISLFVVIKEKRQIFNVKTIFLGMYTIMIGISPIVYYFYNGKTFTANTGNSIIYQFSIILLGYLSMIVGFYIFKKKEKSYVQINKIELEYSRIFSITLLFISSLTNFIFIYINRNAYLGKNLITDASNVVSSQGIILTIAGLYLFGIGILYNYYLNTKKNKKALIFFVVINIILFIIRGNRTSVVLIFAYILLLRNSYKPIKPTSILLLAILLIISVSLLGVVRSNMSSYNSNFFSSFCEDLQVGSININYIYNTFPEKIPFKNGYTYFINILMLRPGSDDDFTIWLKKQIGLNFSGGGVTPTLIGEGYINFGYLGVILIPFLVGILASILNNAYLSKKKDIMFVTYFIIKLIDMFRGGIGNIEISILIATCMYIFYKILFKIYSYRYEIANDL